MINSGSGNQGITVSMPVVEYARELQVSEDRMLRALIVSNLVSIYIKHYIGALSAFCGAVSASCGAGAGISFLCGGDYAQISRTITNTLGNVGGMSATARSRAARQRLRVPCTRRFSRIT